MLRFMFAFVVCALAAAAATSAQEANLLADRVVKFHDGGSGPMAGPYGFELDSNGNRNGFYAVPTTYAADGRDTTTVSLPRGSYLIVAFTKGYVFDGPGPDLFVRETGNAREEGEVFVSRCLMPRFDGVVLSLECKEALWDKFVTGAPRSSH